jgi:very-short-patch-repair endonuclease
MGPKKVQSPSVWRLAQRQHGVITRRQLLELGLSTGAIKHRLATGRLHRVAQGVYAVGRPRLTRYGRWMAAVLSCGPHAVLSHETAAALWGLRAQRGTVIEISVPTRVRRRRKGIRLHRRGILDRADVTRYQRIPLTQPILTLVDLAACLTASEVEAAVNQADKLDLTDPESLRSALDRFTGRPGVATLRKLLDRRTFTLTDSELERRFLALARRADLAEPLTGRRLNGFKVDFYWPELGLVVETDGLRYHRTPTQQAKDRERDQAHAIAGLTTLRFTHAQVRFEPSKVAATLAAMVERLGHRQTTLLT